MIACWILLLEPSRRKKNHRIESFHYSREQLANNGCTFIFAQLGCSPLGREVARFLDENGFDPFNSGDWIQRTHDVWHVLTGLSPSEHDELVLQAFTRAQVFRPSCAILAIAGLLTGKCNFRDIIQGLNSGKLAQPLIDWDIESDWATPLAEVRKKLGIEPLN